MSMCSHLCGLVRMDSAYLIPAKRPSGGVVVWGRLVSFRLAQWFAAGCGLRGTGRAQENPFKLVDKRPSKQRGAQRGLFSST